MVFKNDPFARRAARIKADDPKPRAAVSKRLVQRNYKFPEDLLERIDQARKIVWEDTPNQSEAIRRLLNEALSSKGI